MFLLRGDFYAHDDYIILDMAVDAYAQIILRRSFLITSDCKVNVKKGRLTFDVGQNHVEVVLFETRISHLLHML